MSDNQHQHLLDIHRGWIGYVQPIGLVVAPAVLVRHGIGADSNVAAEQARLLQHLAPDDTTVTDVPAFLRDMLGWQEGDIASAPDDLDEPLPELGTTLRPTFAVPDPTPADGAPPWQMLIGVEPPGSDLDATVDNARAWAATPQARFERLLRATGVPVGLLTNGAVFRLVHTPRGEASGHATFRLTDMREATGRPILSAFLMLLRAERMFGDPVSRLTRLLDESRRYQTEVSAKLATQVLDGLYELLRGLHAADLRTGRTLLTDQVRHDPDQVYAGLLTVMMRLVFVLYAEHRGLFPDHEVWSANYSLFGLHTGLRDDAALHPDTMDDRYGAWTGLLALFRIVHGGISHGDRLKLVARRGGLFDPNRFPFLEGRAATDAPPDPPRVSDGTIWRILQKLMVLDGERLSYRTLDVEQIGSVYETMMGFTVQLTTGQSLAIRSAKRGGAASVIDLDNLLATPPNRRAEVLATQAENKPSAGVAAALRAADSVVGLEAALARSQDRAATPRMVPVGTPVLQPTPARRRSGSHYTPRSLTEPIVRGTLKPILAQLGDNPAPDAILELKVLDPAMGSGAFLVEACRQLADALVAAWSRRDAMPEIPPDEDPLIHARRLVAQRCLYGVDRNPMAVDIAHLSLWLATLAKEHEFTFLSHALRAGDSLVGLDVPRIAALHWDSDGQAPLAANLIRPKIARAEAERARIRSALDWMGEDDLRPLLNRADAELREVRRIGDAVIGAFFSAGNARARQAEAGLLADAYDARDETWVERVADYAAVPNRLDPPLRPFHWPVEFPEVFDRVNPGFDAVVGNPPFAGKNTLAESASEGYPDWLKALHPGAHGNADLVAHFFRRAFELLRDGGCFGLIATNTIRQEVNGSPTHAHHRYAINFADFPLRRERLGMAWLDADEQARAACVREGVVPLDYPDPVAADWPDLLDLVEHRVKPERLRLRDDTSDGRRRKKFWWQWGRYTKGLYQSIADYQRAMVVVQTSKHLCVAILPGSMIYDQKLIVFALHGYAAFAVIQSRTHEVWARFFGSSMKDDPVYAPADCLANFPFPVNYENGSVGEAGRAYYEARAVLMQATNQGLTTIYNRFTDPEDRDPAIDNLRELHATMDRAVLDAYGWSDLHSVAFHDREWEAEEGEKLAPWRLRWPEADRDEVLARLLDLNRRRKEEEAAQDALAPRPTRRRAGRRTPAAAAPLFAGDL